MRCPYCEEYDVDDIPVGDGCMGNICTECREYTIPVTDETGTYYWLPDEEEK